MAENKKSIVVYADWMVLFEALEDDEAGRLIKHFFRYVNDLNPKAPDRITELSFISIKQQLKRDLLKWEEKAPERIDKARNAGIASGKARQLKATKTNSLVQNELKPTKRTVTVTVNDNVNVDDITKKGAYEFLKEKNKEEIEVFEMQNKNSFKKNNDFDLFISNFNNKVTLEEIEFKPSKLMARLQILNSNWDKKPKKEEIETKAILNFGNPNR